MFISLFYGAVSNLNGNPLGPEHIGAADTTGHEPNNNEPDNRRQNGKEQV